MRRLWYWIAFAMSFAALLSCSSKQEKKVLVYSRTEGFRHGSIEAGQQAIEKLGKDNGFQVILTEDPNYFTEDSLKDISTVIFLNTTGDVLNYYQQADFERYIQSGGGYVGLHAATDTEYEWPWYNRLVGAYFDGHPKIQEAKLKVLDKNHPSTSMLPDEWIRKDEWYNFKDLNPEVKVLITIDETSYEGGKNGDPHPMAWYHAFDGGRAFYTEFGHTDESFEEPLFLQHLLGGIQYAMGDNQRDYTKATTDRVPLENRFVRTVLAQNLEEPMELEYLPNHKILFIERKGAVKVYNLATEELKTVAEIPVQHEPGEDGLLGLALDPDYERNHWIYLYYTPEGEESVQRLSRFEFAKDELNFASEKVLLKVPTERDCCHSGGSVEFGPDGLLYLSTGDNTNPFESNGYSPSDERDGRAVWDAQKSSANTNDLRGKILRIKPEPDGTYSIPEGNLFPEGTSKTRPEIYVMGLRNPFRISVDHKTGYLYWGDVGPDAGKDGEKRGPKGLDELNQARKAGNWGWPYTRGNNQLYYDYDFEKKEPKAPFDPNNLINNSPNNTGLEKLPPAQPSLIWYSYDKSEEFPWTGTGGKNPMAGPIYYAEQFKEIDSRFPDYFNGKVFFYDWMRDWIYIITLDENQNYQKAEPFMPNSVFNNPTDMIFGRDGNLYVLEYGEKWRARNLEARLNKIEYVKGNRAPIARIESDKTIGAAPFTVQFSGLKSEDLEMDPLSYQWSFEGGEIQANEAQATYTFQQPGTYKVRLTVKDSKGVSAVATKEIIVGNEPPVVRVEIASAHAFYKDNGKVAYTIKVNDKEDGSTEDGRIAAENVTVSLTYLPEGKDIIQASKGHQPNLTPKGKILMDGSDCKACHAVDKKISGPSYQQVAEKYTEKDTDYLVSKILEGGSGVWGDAPMSAHPQLKEGEVREIVKYVLSLKKEEHAQLPLKGSLRFDQHQKGNTNGVYILTATYTDQGNGAITSITAQEQLVFKAPFLEAKKADEISDGVSAWNGGGKSVLGGIKHGKSFAFKEVLLTGLKSVDLSAYYVSKYDYAGKVEVRKGSREGEKIGEIQLGYSHAQKDAYKTYTIPLQSASGKSDLYFVFVNEQDKDRYVANAHAVYLNY
ncbi:ThuA domain-containing protein [Rapidithrix thailandica]|uniref:ThuA domain-containing protein n=1 Tax=Rapidithrix thailandica TaxID=413964 RepID=A0AAW9SAX3_9BACT